MIRVAEVVRKRIQFYGEVQAVGFRWKASHAAEAYRLTGWVQNEWDGSVLMEIQGPEDAIDEVVATLNRDRYIVIDRMEVYRMTVDEDEHSFRIRGW